MRPVNPGVPALTPPFTEQDVRDYLSRCMPLMKITHHGQITVTRVVFTAVAELDQASRRFGSNYPPDMPICYVELSGDFQVWGPPGVSGAHPARPASSSDTAYILFDAHTGNFIGVGMSAQPKQPSDE